MRLLFLSLISLLTTSAFAEYSLTVDSAAPSAASTSGMVYRFYVNADDASDKLSAVYGSDSSPLVISTPDGIFNSPATAGATAEGLTDFLLGFFPDVADDSFVTVNLDGDASSSGIPGAAAPQIVEDPALTNGITSYFSGDNDGTLLEVNTLIGGSWFLTGSAGNASPDTDGRWLIAQVTTGGDISGSVNVQVFPLGIQSETNVVRKSFDFDGVGEYFSAAILGCMDETACNYNPEVTEDDGSCAELDECGVCGGMGIPDGECDCDGTVIDECGVCGGAGIPDGQCDCDGTLIDAIGVCGGDCAEDVNANGICDDEEVYGCMISLACNYDPNANVSDGSCDYCSCGGQESSYPVVVESAPAVGSGGTVYRFYVQMQEPTDRLSAVFGNDVANLSVNAPMGVFNDPTNTSWSATGINPLILPFFPNLADDSYATIGLSGPASSIPGAEDPSLVQDSSQPITPFFLNDGETTLSSTTLTGCSWYVLNTASNGLPDEDGRVQIMQVTTSGEISGTLNYQVFPLGDGGNDVLVSTDFSGAGIFGGNSQATGCGCTDSAACNYDPTAVFDDGSCYVEDEDADGICDEADPCVGAVDDCGVCNGGNASCSGCLVEFACNYNPEAFINDFDQCDFESCAGCLDEMACNYDSSATIGDVCIYVVYGTCDCAGNGVDADNDGLCDDVDGCVGEYDDCGVCNGDNSSCADECGVPNGDNSSCADECGVPNGDNSSCADECGVPNGDNSSCADECGVPNGPGIPDGQCDCDGTLPNACGSCGEQLDVSVYYATPLEIPDNTGDELNVELQVAQFEEGQTLQSCSDLSSVTVNIEHSFIGDLSFSILCPNGTEVLLMDNGPVGGPDPTGCTTEDLGGNDLGLVDTEGADYSWSMNAEWILDDANNPSASSPMPSGLYLPCGNLCDLEGCPLNGTWTFIATDQWASDNGSIFGWGLEFGGQLTLSEEGCTDVNACNYNSEATCDDGSCLQAQPEACDCDGTVIDECGVCGGAGIPDGQCDCDGNQLDALGECGGLCEADEDADGICDDEEVSGCMISLACNYNPEATISDSSCDFTSCLVFGCMDVNACNYDPGADNEDGSCEFETCYGCMAVWSCNYDPNVIYDDGSCEHESCLGCTYAGACNYDEEATFDDGSCDFNCLLAGCTDPNAVNHYPAALTDDGSCLYSGCLDPEGLDYDPTATYSGGCDYPDPCPGDFTGDGVVDINDLLDFFQLWGNVCELTEEEIQSNGPGEGAGPGGEDTGNSAWSCGDTWNYQGYDYETVLIGEQCWFAENLRVSNFADGSAIPSVYDTDDWIANEGPSVNIYGDTGWAYDGTVNTIENDSLFGKLYNYAAVIHEGGLCPADWHISTDNDWYAMTSLFGGPAFAANALKTPGNEDSSTGLWGSSCWTCGGSTGDLSEGTNSSGLTVRPSGMRGYNNWAYAGLFVSAEFWSPDDEDLAVLWFRQMHGWSSSVGRSGGGAVNEFSNLYSKSIRCVKD